MIDTKLTELEKLEDKFDNVVQDVKYDTEDLTSRVDSLENKEES